MFKNSSKIMFYLIMMLGTLISVSSNSWLGTWMGLEINLLAFIPLMTASNNLMSTEASLKYFLIQAIASSTLMFSIINYMIMYKITFEMSTMLQLLNLAMAAPILMKMGAAPLHFWFPSVMEGSSWMTGLMLMTWQKIAPLMMTSYLIINSMTYNLIIILSVMVGSLGGLNQTSLRKIMAFSSINHLGWMLMAMLSNEILLLVYFIIYSIIAMTLTMMFNMFNLLHMNQMFTMFFKSKIIKFILMMNLLSLGGLPPFTGFLPKWLVIQYLTTNNQLFMMTVLTTTTLITLYFYIRLCYSGLMMNYYETNWTMYSLYSNFLMSSFIMMSFLSMNMLVSISFVFLML